VPLDPSEKYADTLGTPFKDKYTGQEFDPRDGQPLAMASFKPEKVKSKNLSMPSFPEKTMGKAT
jgi:hypothetical protein